MAMTHRHMFPGNNTSVGFFSYYDYIMPQNEANHIFCLKGGPGVGKSTFMGCIANRLIKEGQLIEFMHCSSDPESLDAIAIPALKIALLDGTTPHVIDPVNPGAVDEIINLGEFWDITGIKRFKDEIIGINAEVGRLFRTAYRYILAAKSLMDDALSLCDAVMDRAGIYAEADHIVKKHMPEYKAGAELGKVRKMFASAITPNGIVHYIDTLIGSDYYSYVAESQWGAGVSEMLSRVSQEAVMRGYDTEHYYCPMEPGKRLEHIVIPALKIALFSSNQYIEMVSKPQEVIRMDRYMDTRVTADFDEREFDVLIKEALYTLNRAKVTHDEMEKYYIPNMNFQGVDKKSEEITNAVLSYANQHS